MAFFQDLYNEVYAHVSGDAQLLTAFDSTGWLTVDAVPPNFAVPHMVMRFDEWMAVDKVVRSGKLWFDLWYRTSPSIDKSFSITVLDRLELLFHEKVYYSASQAGTCRFWFKETKTRSVTVAGGLAQDQLFCATMCFDLRAVQARLAP